MVLVVIALVLAACTSSPGVSLKTTTVLTKPLPAIDLSATPTGWVPIAYGDAQVSVPRTWWVSYQGPTCGGPLPGLLVVQLPKAPPWCGPGSFPKGTTRPTPPKSIVTVDPETGTYHVPPSPSLVIHGISLYVLSRGPTVRYLVPGLRVIVTTTGPLGRPVLDTLSFSPRAVVMSKGALATPRTWRWQEFGGVRFATPATWPTQRTNLFTQCRSFVALGGRKVVAYSSQTVIEPDNPVVELDTDRTRYTGSCVFGNFQEYAPGDGVQVDARVQVGQGPTFPNPVYRFTTSQCLRLHGLTACPGTSLSYSILVLKVTVPGRSKPVYVSIGLAGNGMVARTILYSLRASPAIGHPLRIAGTIAGTLVRVGGPAPGAPFALPGQVTARSSAGRKFTAIVGKSGKFVLSVSPGDYKLTGHSPLVSQETCTATKPVRVKMGQRVSGMEVICSIR